MCREYLRNIEFNINLESLYEVVDHLSYNCCSTFAPVLLRIVDSKLKKLNGLYDFCLKVFDKEGGVVY